MKSIFLTFFLLASMASRAQDCKLLTQTFAIADTMKKESGDLYLFRFSAKQLEDLRQLPMLEKPVAELIKLQKTLDEDNGSFKQGIFWQLDGKLAERQLMELRKQCPETGFKVFEREIAFYKRNYKPRTPDAVSKKPGQ